MKIIRSTRCSLKFCTDHKIYLLKKILAEYGRVVNIFIEHFWNTGVIQKRELLKPIVDMPKTWISYRLRAVAAREALDMISSTKERHKLRPDRMIMPVHKGRRMWVSTTIVNVTASKKTNEFDAWLHVWSVGNGIVIDLPLKFHNHFNMLQRNGKMLNAFILTKDFVQFCFEIETGEKKEVKSLIGIDTGINILAATSQGKQFGKDIKEFIERIKRCKWGSRGQRRARNALKQRISEVAKEAVNGVDLVVVEKLKNLGKNSKLKRRLSKNIRRSIGSWNYRYWLKRLEQQCEWNRVSFRTVSPLYTSQRCSKCGHTDRRNRHGEMFECQVCGHIDNADINAAKNILDRFLTGPYGACYRSIKNGNGKVYAHLNTRGCR